MGQGLVAGFSMGVLGGGAGYFRGQQPDPGITSLVSTGSPPSNSPVVGTTTVNVGGKQSIKVTRQDGSVDIDGVLVSPPTSAGGNVPADLPVETPSTGIVAPETTTGTNIPPSDQDSQDRQKMIDEIEGKPLETPVVKTPVAETPTIEAVTPEVPTTPVFDSNNDLLDALKTRGEQVESYQDAINRLSNGQQIFAFHDQMGDGDMPMLITSIEQLDAYTPDQLLALPP